MSRKIPKIVTNSISNKLLRVGRQGGTRTLKPEGGGF